MNWPSDGHISKFIADALKFEPPIEFETSQQIRKAVIERDRICQYCGMDENLHVDHIIPMVRGGKAVMNNLQALCASCNTSKGKKIFKEIL